MWIFKAKYQAKRENIKCLMIVKYTALKTRYFVKQLLIEGLILDVPFLTKIGCHKMYVLLMILQSVKSTNRYALRL